MTRRLFGPEHLDRVAATVAAIARTPAFPTQDWCERLAFTLQPLGPDGAVVVLLAEFGADGVVRAVEASGAVAGPEAAPFDPHTVHPVGAHEAGWRPRDTGDDAGSVALADGAPWRASPACDRWRSRGVEALLTASARMSEAEPSRRFVVEFGLTSARDAGAELTTLEAVLPYAVDRARVAFGPTTTSAADRVTPQERVILELLATGRTVKQVAEWMQRSPHTVHDHVKSLHRKLEAKSRGELIARAFGHRPDVAEAAGGAAPDIRTMPARPRALQRA